MRYFIILAYALLFVLDGILAQQRYYQNNYQNSNYLRPLSGYGQPAVNTVKKNTPEVQYSTYNDEVVNQKQNTLLVNEPLVNQNSNDQIDRVIENGVNQHIEKAESFQGNTQSRINQAAEMKPAIKSVSNSVSFINPCTAEVLRMSDIILFKDPTDKRSYLICTDIEEFHTMPCPEGTIFNEELHHCVPEGYEAPKCPDLLCKNDADCLVDETNSFKCICKAGFSGQFCEVNIDECALGGTNACSGGKCVDQINGYYCVFPTGLIGIKSEKTIANPCTLENFAKEAYFFEIPSIQGNVWLQCVGEMTFVVSRCAEHLFWNNELQTCTIEKPIAKSGVCRELPCKNGGECQDLGNTEFQCLCRVGFTGDLCESIVDLCVSNPCLNGGRCLSWVGGYTCVCQNKIIDDTCTSGLINPCPPKASLIQGFNDYFAHPSNEKFFHCDKDGRAFARSCPINLKWKQEVLSCVSSKPSLTPEPKQIQIPSSTLRPETSTKQESIQRVLKQRRRKL